MIVLLQGQFKVLVAGCHHAYVEKSVKSEQRLYGEERKKNWSIRICKMVCLDIHHILVKFQSVAVCICVGIAFSRFFDMKNLIKNGGSKLEILKTACGYNFRQNGILQ